MSSLVRWQENSSFASRRVGLCVGVCKCAVLCVGCPFFFQSLSSKLSAVVCLFTLGGNVLQLPEGGDFEALHCQPSTNFDRSTKLDLTTDPPLLGRCCWLLALFVVYCFKNCQFFNLFLLLSGQP